MKKFLSLLLVLSLAAAFSACGNQEAPSTEIADENTTTALTQEKTEATEEKAESPKVTKTEVPATSTEGADEKSDASTQPTEPVTPTKPVDTQASSHTHNFSIPATCTEAKKCACGATEGSALGHDFKSMVCTRCGAQQPSNFPDLKNYYWKSGKEIVNAGVPGKEALAPYAVELVLLDFQRGFANVSSGDSWLDGTSSDPSFLYPSPNPDAKARVYNGKVYSATTETFPRFTYQEEDSLLVLTFSGGGTLTLKKNGADQLTVVSVTGISLPNVSAGTVFKAYPRWEIFNGV